MKKDKAAFKYTLFFTGLIIASFGIAFSVKAGLGTSPISALPYSISLVNNSLTFGEWLNILSMIQISIQVILLRSRCRPAEIIIQIILAFFYGYLTDFSCGVLEFITVESYGARLFCSISGCFILALGIWMQLKGGVAMLPGEAMNKAISIVSGKRYENIKIIFDIGFILSAAAVCLVFLGELKGVREGSIIAAVSVGNIVKIYNRMFDAAKRRFLIKKELL